MKKLTCKIFSVVALIILGFALTGCAYVNGDGVKSESKYNVGEFTAANVNGYFILNIEVNKYIKKNIVTVSAEKNILPLLVPTVKDGVLTIQSSESISETMPIMINIQANTLSKLSIRGAIKGCIDVSNLDSLTFSSHGAVDFAGKGTVKDLTIEYHGNNNLNFVELKSENLKIDGNGVFSVKAYSSKSIDSSLSGVGELTYLGSPSSVIENHHGLVVIKDMK